jgi:hypothetical protein
MMAQTSHRTHFQRYQGSGSLEISAYRASNAADFSDDRRKPGFLTMRAAHRYVRVLPGRGLLTPSASVCASASPLKGEDTIERRFKTKMVL